MIQQTTNQDWDMGNHMDKVVDGLYVGGFLGEWRHQWTRQYIYIHEETRARLMHVCNIVFPDM